MPPILPGATLGILGGGQLGRMTAMAARSLGYHIHTLDPDASCAARFVVERCLTAAFDDDFAAADLARHCAVVTLEIEKISLASLAAARRYAPVRPGADILAIVQDRARQKDWLANNGFPVGAYRKARSAAELRVAAEELGGRCYVKATRDGYDGRGQAMLDGPADAERIWSELGERPVIAEKSIDLAAELSVLVARRPSGDVAIYPVALNHHEDRILAWSVLPGPLPPTIAERAQEIAGDLARTLSLEGLLVVELFLTKDDDLLVNELAPRPHNTFHATEVGSATSQFEQIVRAICDLPLGSVETVRPAAILNLLGDLWLDQAPPRFEEALAEPGVRVHLYGKRVARPGRKMGHLSAIGATPEEAVARVKRARERLTPRP